MVRHVVIVGAGPAGMSAAIQAVERGCLVTLIDEGLSPGGQIFRQPVDNLKGISFADSAEIERKRRIFSEFESVSDRINYLSETVVYAIFPGPELHVSRGNSTSTISADGVIIATGVREKVPPFPGWTLPGVLSAGGAQSLIKSQMVLPGKVAVVAGAGPLPMVVAAQMVRSGIRVQALAELNSTWKMARSPLALWKGRQLVKEGVSYFSTLLKNNVKRHARMVPIKAEGDLAIESVTLARLDSSGGVISGSEISYNCDLLAINFGFVTNHELAAMCGIEMKYNAILGGWLPKVDCFGRTSKKGIYVCGDGVALRGALVAQAEGSIVGACIAADLEGRELDTSEKVLASAIKERKRYSVFQSGLRETLKLPEGIWGLADADTVVCRCEHVSKGELISAFEQGHISVNAAKRNTRCGMGWCAGRNCSHTVMAMAELYSGQPPEEPMTPRPLVRPVSLGALANRDGIVK